MQLQVGGFHGWLLHDHVTRRSIFYSHAGRFDIIYGGGRFGLPPFTSFSGGARMLVSHSDRAAKSRGKSGPRWGRSFL